jgi:hypothetical protein
LAALFLLEAEGFFDKVAVVAFVVVAGGRYELDVFLNSGLSFVSLAIARFMGFLYHGVHELSLEMYLTLERKLLYGFIFA